MLILAEIDAICHDCAIKNEGSIPYEGYTCTVWKDICSYCKQEKTVCSITDYDWKKK